MVAGFLLARAGIKVTVLEKHNDFFRDFRGDTIHPSTLQLMYELGLLEEFLRLPHQEYRQLSGRIGDFTVIVADFTHLKTHCKFIALMPQWDFLNFLAAHGKRYPEFTLMMETEATELIEEDGRVVGVRAKSPHGPIEIRARLTIGADGRHSIVRERAGFQVIDRGAPIDVLWMRISRERTDPDQTLGRFREGKLMVTLDRDDYWQCAYIIPKGGFDAIKQRGLERFREDIVTVVPEFKDRVGELKEWEQIKLLSVAVDHLRQWCRPGLLCIGDSAHAMSPIGGVGINLAIQDAVATANIIAEPMIRQELFLEHLQAVQHRREFPTRVIQLFQVFAHKRFVGAALRTTVPLKKLPPPLAVLEKFPYLRRLPAWFIGVGVRPEHVHTTDPHVTAHSGASI